MIGNIVRVKEDKAFDYSVFAHYGEIVEEDREQIKIRTDMRFTHDSFSWANKEDYEVIV